MSAAVSCLPSTLSAQPTSVGVCAGCAHRKGPGSLPCTQQPALSGATSPHVTLTASMPCSVPFRRHSMQVACCCISWLWCWPRWLHAGHLVKIEKSRRLQGDKLEHTVFRIKQAVKLLEPHMKAELKAGEARP